MPGFLLFSKTPETLLPGCLAHPDDSQVEEILNVFTMEHSKVGTWMIGFLRMFSNLNYFLFLCNMFSFCNIF